MFEEQQTVKRVWFVTELSKMGKRFIISIPKAKNEEVKELWPDKYVHVTIEEAQQPA